MNSMLRYIWLFLVLPFIMALPLIIAGSLLLSLTSSSVAVSTDSRSDGVAEPEKGVPSAGQPLSNPTNLTNQLGQPLRPLAGLLNPDGTLNLSTGFTGSVDPCGWQMQTGKDGRPVFVPSALSVAVPQAHPASEVSQDWQPARLWLRRGTQRAGASRRHGSRWSWYLYLLPVVSPLRRRKMSHSRPRHS